MAEFKSFVSGVEVNGETILTIIKAMKEYKNIALGILRKNGINHLQPGKWYPQQQCLNAFKEIYDILGNRTILNLGKAIPKNTRLSSEINNLEEGLMLINKYYQKNHRGGEVGYYKLVSYNEEEQQAVIECKNPYPSHFDRGIISWIAKRCKSSEFVCIELDETKPTRLKGADSCTFNINWMILN